VNVREWERGPELAEGRRVVGKGERVEKRFEMAKNYQKEKRA